MVSEQAGIATGLVAIDALGAAGEYRTRNREIITTTAGVAVAEMSMAPPLYVSRTLSAQRKVTPLPLEHRLAALTGAADIFANGNIAGLDFESYVGLASRISGLPIAVTRAGARSVVDAVGGAFDAVRPARPVGAALDWREEDTRTGGAVWVRRGEVFAVHAAGNGPGVHGLWPQALALGYRVAVRPSRRGPLTAPPLGEWAGGGGISARGCRLSADRPRRCRRDHPLSRPRHGVRGTRGRRQVRPRSDG